MKPDHARYAEWDSAYVLGSLSPADRRAYEEHLESCETCRRSVAELAPIPGLLARLAPDRAMALLDEGADEHVVPPTPRRELLDAVRREGRRRRIRRTRFLVVAAATAAAVVLGAILVPIALLRPTGDAADAQTVAFETVADVPVEATATLTPVAWGTQIELDCTYDDAAASDAPDAGWPYALVVVDRDGDRSEISSWRAHPGQTAQLAAGTAVALDDIVSLEIRGINSGKVLLAGSTE